MNNRNPKRFEPLVKNTEEYCWCMDPSEEKHLLYPIRDPLRVRESTAKERELIKWCKKAQHTFPRAVWPNAFQTISNIAYNAIFHYPIQKEWLDEILPHYLAELAPKWRNWKTKTTDFQKELEEAEQKP